MISAKRESQATDLFYFENRAWRRFALVAGLDEAGRGAWAGPVAAAAVIFEPCVTIAGVDDSKVLTPKKRDFLFEKICASAKTYGIGMVGPEEIDRINILEASKLAMLKALEMMSCKPEHLLIDGPIHLETDLSQEAIVDGDALSFSIAAASILAKVARDRVMVELDKTYPGYGFASHKGYGTKEHRQSLAKLGCTPIHRRSYRPVAQVL